MRKAIGAFVGASLAVTILGIGGLIVGGNYLANKAYTSRVSTEDQVELLKVCSIRSIEVKHCECMLVWIGKLSLTTDIPTTTIPAASVYFADAYCRKLYKTPEVFSVVEKQKMLNLNPSFGLDM